MRSPNGLGGIVKMSGKRRNPYRVRITAGWEVDADGQKVKQIQKTIGYFPDKKSAMAALIEYNSNPYSFDAKSITFSEVFSRWSSEHFQEIAPSATRTYKSAFTHSGVLHDMPMADIRVAHLEKAIDIASCGQATKQRMKSLYNQMYRYAMKHEIVEKDYSALCNAVKDGEKQIDRLPFTSDEISALWSNISAPYTDMILIGIYTGWRPQELCSLKCSDIDIDNGIMQGGMKTDAGRDRIVPIHSCIRDLIDARLKSGNEYLFTDEAGCALTYDKYKGRFNKLMQRNGFQHRPHDTRHTFITLGKNAGMNEYILKLIVGHAIRDLTESTYTHRTIEELKNEIEKIEK